jgi:hypothetical protein
MPTELERWKSRQIQAAIERGTNKLDAIRAMNDFLRLLPVGADPQTYIVPAHQLDQDLSSEIVRLDASAAWIEQVDARYALLLDASQ